MNIIPRPYYQHDFIDRIPQPHGFVGEILRAEMERWTPWNPAFISAQTGAGKNTFIEQNIMPACATASQTLLIISNRIAVNRQAKIRIAKKLGLQKLLEHHTPAGLDALEEFGNVFILSYHALGAYTYNLPKAMRQADVVVFDEAHFFCADALFNSSTTRILGLCVNLFHKAIRIYLTATPFEVLPHIAKAEEEVFTLKYRSVGYQVPFHHRCLFLYDFKRDFSSLQVAVLDSLNDLPQRIFASDPDEKWLVFVSSKKQGAALVQQCKGQAVLVTADSRSGAGEDAKEYNNLVEKSKFFCRILVATSALDNGINILDDAVKHVVIDTYDHVEFLQMLGRKRIRDNEKVTLHLLKGSPTTVMNLHHKLAQNAQAIYAFMENRADFLSSYVQQADTFAKGLFHFDNVLQLQVNQLAKDKIFADLDRMASLREALSLDSIAYIQQQLGWLGLEDRLEELVATKEEAASVKVEALCDFLSANCDQTLNQEQQASFAKSFKELYAETFGKRKNDRSDRAYGLTVIGRILREHSLPYTLKHVEGSWVLHRTSA